MHNPSFDPQICRQCRGLCCQGHPGAWVDPGRFKALFFPGRSLSLAVLRAETPRLGLNLRDFSGVPVPAPRSVEEGCVFLGAEGCRLSVRQRPCQCLALVPTLETLLEGEIRCHLPGSYGYKEVRRAWEAFWAQRSNSLRL